MGTFASEDRDLSPGRVRELLESGRAELVDVREPYEREAGRIAGSRHVEMERLASEAEGIPRDRPVVFHCRLGARSALAARAFERAGYDAYNLEGGIQAWVDAGHPIQPEGGYVADH
ncbi:MAG TPA: rhodanese-like domain-containing protein [Thermoleophilaceae bacterium]|nr:rhodanese-like domain-containing protein [Thermoleophilaceae bacterium]